MGQYFFKEINTFIHKDVKIMLKIQLWLHRNIYFKVW